MTQTVDKTSHSTVGQSTRRQDGFDKVTGRTRYAGDLSIGGLLHARLALSPYAHARIVAIDVSAAMQVPGVKAVYTSETLGVADPAEDSVHEGDRAADAGDRDGEGLPVKWHRGLLINAKLRGLLLGRLDQLVGQSVPPVLCWSRLPHHRQRAAPVRRSAALPIPGPIGGEPHDPAPDR